MNITLHGILLVIVSVNGLIFSIISMYHVKRLNHNPFIPVLLLVLSLMFFDEFVRQSPDLFTQIPDIYFSFTFSGYLILPAFYLMIRSMLFSSRLRWYDIFHTIPVFFVYYYTGIFNFMKFGSEIKKSAYTSIMNRPDPLAAILTFDFQIIFYLLLILFMITRKYDLSFLHLFRKLRLWIKVFYGLTVIHLLISALIISCLILDVYLYRLDILKTYLLSIPIYGWLIVIINNPNSFQLPIKGHRIWADQFDALDCNMKDIVQRIREKDLHLNGDIQLFELSNELGMSSRKLTELVNKNLGIPVPQLLNLLRIKEMEKRINLSEYNNYTILGLAKSVGFKSKTSFYRVFNQFHKETPAQYFKNLQS